MTRQELEHQQHPWLVWALIVLGVASRLVPHPWNVTPVMSIALFGGACLPRRWAMVLPLAIVAVSDVLIGWHQTVPFTWGAFLLSALLGFWIRREPGPGRIIAGTLISSALFFLITNFGVWTVGELYPQTAAGLWECYVAAIPFFKQELLGDLVYTAALFGGYAVAMRRLAAQRA